MGWTTVVQLPAEVGTFSLRDPGAHPQGTLSPGVKRSGREADHRRPPNVDFKNEWKYTSTSPYVFMAWCFVVLI